MSPTDYQAAIDAFVRTKGITRCPTVCAVPTQATVADADRAAYRNYVTAREAERRDRLKSAQEAPRLWTPPQV